MALKDVLEGQVAHLPDEMLIRELWCAKRCALTSTRTRRDLAQLRARCVCRELERRGHSAAAINSMLNRAERNVSEQG